MSSIKKEHADFFIWLEETYARRGREATDGTGKQVGMHTVILDFEHFSMKQITCKTGNALLLASTVVCKR